MVILLSNSGETNEILRLIPSLKLIGAKLIGITGNGDSALARNVGYPRFWKWKKEACYLNLAPTASTTAMLVYGDATAVTASEEMGFGTSDFGLFHPAGTLGKSPDESGRYYGQGGKFARSMQKDVRLQTLLWR